MLLRDLFVISIHLLLCCDRFFKENMYNSYILLIPASILKPLLFSFILPLLLVILPHLLYLISWSSDELRGCCAATDRVVYSSIPSVQGAL